MVQDLDYTACSAMYFSSSAADIGNPPAGNTFKGQLLARLDERFLLLIAHLFHLSDAGNSRDDVAVSVSVFVPSEGILPAAAGHS